MKRCSKLVSLLAAAAMFALLPGTNVLRVSAAQPTTYILQYNSEKCEWRMQTGEWKDGDDGKELYYMNQGDEKIKDGDIVVVQAPDGNDGAKELTINVRLSNLTINRTNAVVMTKGIDECYVLGSSYAAINGDVTNAYVYDNAICTFNNNVNTLTISSKENTQASVSVGGTTAHVIEKNGDRVVREIYNVAAGKLFYNANGVLETLETYYSTTPPATEKPAAAPAKPTQSSGSAAGDEYDDVPKTGESSLLLWLAGISALCFAGSWGLKRVLR